VNVDGASAVVTGGASGLGRATADALAAAGARVVVIDLAGAPAGFAHELVRGDVTDPDAVSAAVSRAGGLGPLRVVVNCAGVATPGRVLRRDGALPLDEFRRVLDINVAGTFNVIRLAAAAMRDAGELGDGERGVVVSTSSVAAFDGQIGQAAYSAAKAAIAGMTLPLARDLAEHKIRVVGVAPGMFRTPLLAGLPPAAIASLGEQVPHPARLGEPEEFAALVTHIVSNPMINGEVIRIDGAIRMAPR
jgi:NAD(P)-dependent dehydrogenase (short-subunit alcohol dehydrogenase family)